MNMSVILPLLFKIGMALLLALLTLFSSEAQNAPEHSKKIHLKVIREVDGKTELLDTVIYGAGDAELARIIKGSRIDSARMRTLTNAELRVAGTASDLKFINAELLKSGMAVDSTIGRLLRDSRNIIRLDSSRMVVNGKAMTIRSHAHTIDSLVKLGAPLRLQHPDSLEAKRYNQVIIVKKGDTVAFNSLMTDPRSTMLMDSLLLHRSGKGERLSLDPAGIERIIVHKSRGGSTRDTLLMQTHSERLKIETDPATGQKKVYRLEHTGAAHELEAAVFSPRIIETHTIIMVQSEINEMTPADKKALQAAGASVETSAKEELKLEEVTYYPNPSNGRFNLSFRAAQKGNTLIRVMDQAGRIIFSDQVKKLEGEYSREIDISGYGPGVFFVQVAQGKRYFTRKLVVQ